MLQGCVHITGGGFTENLPRVMPKGLACEVQSNSWEWPPLFQWLQQVPLLSCGMMPVNCMLLPSHRVQEYMMLVCFSPFAIWSRLDTTAGCQCFFIITVCVCATQNLLKNVIKSAMQCFLQAGNIATAEMYRTFNMGVGMVVVVPASDVEKALATDGAAFALGSVVKGDEVQIV